MVALDGLTGDVNWARSAGGTAQDVAHGIANDDSGNVYITGAFEGEAAFGPFTLCTVGWSAAHGRITCMLQLCALLARKSLTKVLMCAGNKLC